MPMILIIRDSVLEELKFLKNFFLIRTQTSIFCNYALILLEFAYELVLPVIKKRVGQSLG